MQSSWQVSRSRVHTLMGNGDGTTPTSSFCSGRWPANHPNLRRRNMEVAVYARVSTERPQQAQTIEQQLARLQAQVTQQPKWHLAEAHIYRDDGFSGAKLNRPGLDRLRDHARFGEFELVLITAPDRLARKYVHQVLIIEELQAVGCRIEFLERPMSDDPNDQLLLQIRGAVAEYERTLIAERMRRGRQAKLRSGQLLPWSRPPTAICWTLSIPANPAGCIWSRCRQPW